MRYVAELLTHLVEYAGYDFLRVGFEVSFDSHVGCVAQPCTRLVGYADYGLLRWF